MVKENFEGLSVTREKDFSKWFVELALKSELADYSDVSGCMILRPSAYAMWEKIKEECDKEFKKIGVKNVYFPLFIPEKLFKKEQEHVEGFAPEVAWVTHTGNTKLKERLAIRPTSEAIMYETYSKWIRSHTDLPLLLNQWNNVVRWEFNNPVLFFRTREFLWNEMHTAFATEKEAIKHGNDVIKAYNFVTEKIMALPGIYGRKTEKEKFSGAVFTEKVHHYLPNGRIIEGTCFHFDGQNFAKAYNINFIDKKGKKDFVYQNTHAISTRMLGAMFAIHSDNKGLIIPPKMAPNKIVIVPILFDKSKKQVLDVARKLKEDLIEFEPILDDRANLSPGKKFNEYELKGIPLRIEIGPNEIKDKSVIVKIRNKEEKIKIKISVLKKEIPIILEKMQKELYDKAKKVLEANKKRTDDKKELIQFIKEKQMVLVPLSNSKEAEELLKAETGGAKVLFIDSTKKSAGKKCIMTGKKADYLVWVGRSY